MSGTVGGRVPTLPERVRAVPWPAPQEAERVALASDATFLLAAGFEDRVTAVLGRAIDQGAREFRTVCVQYLPLVPENKEAEVRRLCGSANGEVELITYDRERPAEAARGIAQRFRCTGDIHIDISGMSRLLIVQLIAHVIKAGLASRTCIWYAEAHDYPPAQADVKAGDDPGDPLAAAMFLSNGVFGVTVVPELSSVAMQGQPIRLIVFPSFNSMQMAAVWAEIQASSYTLVNGAPPLPEYGWRPDAIRSMNRVQTLQACDETTTSTLDYRETLAMLLDVYSRHSQREKLVVSPTGSKMQSVAVGIMRGLFSDVQVVYPTPRTFDSPTDYTHGVRAVFALPLAAFDPQAMRNQHWEA